VAASLCHQGLEELQDKPRPGKQPIYTPPPENFARGTGPLPADVEVQYVLRFLRSHKIDLAARKLV
jgi:hypothetical protein